jgi:hypothetical protein
MNVHGFGDDMLDCFGRGLEEGRAKKQRGVTRGDLADGKADRRDAEAGDKQVLLFAKEVEALEDAAGRQATERAAKNI